MYLWRNPATGAPPRCALPSSARSRDHDATQPLDRGIVRTHWLSQPELQEREGRLRSPLVLRCVEDYLAGEQRPLEGVAQLDLHSAAAVAPTVRL